MKLTDLISLRILCVFAYLNMLFSICVFYVQPIVYDRLCIISHKKIHFISLNEISLVYASLLLVDCILIIAAIVEFIRRDDVDISKSESVYKKIFYFIFSLLFYFGLIFTIIFIIIYSNFLFKVGLFIT